MSGEDQGGIKKGHKRSINTLKGGRQSLDEMLKEIESKQKQEQEKAEKEKSEKERAEKEKAEQERAEKQKELSKKLDNVNAAINFVETKADPNPISRTKAKTLVQKEKSLQKNEMPDNKMNFAEKALQKKNRPNSLHH